MKLITVTLMAALATASCRGDAPTAAPPDRVYSIEKVGGDEQSTMVTRELTEPLVVRISRNGAPAAARLVTWSVVGGDAAILSSDEATDASGLAEARVTLGEAAGRVRVRVSLTAGGSVEFSSTALPGPPARVRLGSGFSAVPVGESREVAAQVHDAFGNEIERAALTLESRAGEVLSTSLGTVRGLARGTAVVVARVGATADSAAYAVVEPGEAAVAWVDASGRAFASAETGSELEMRLVALHAAGHTLSAIQGRASWSGDVRYVSDGAADDGFSWAANVADAAAGMLRFAAWSPGAAGDRTALGSAILQAPDGAGSSLLSSVVEVAGDELGRDITGRVVAVSTSITFVSGPNP